MDAVSAKAKYFMSDKRKDRSLDGNKRRKEVIIGGQKEQISL